MPESRSMVNITWHTSRGGSRSLIVANRYNGDCSHYSLSPPDGLKKVALKKVVLCVDQNRSCMLWWKDKPQACSLFAIFRLDTSTQRA